jgi:hypothetical protein
MPLETETQQQLATWTIESNLRVEVYLNSELMVSKPETDLSATFTRWCSENELMLIEIRIAQDHALLSKQRGYFRMLESTFERVPRTPLPMNMFNIIPI